MLASLVLMTGASAETWTDSDRLPICRSIESSLVESTCSATFSTTDVLKPCISTVRA